MVSERFLSACSLVLLLVLLPFQAAASFVQIWDCPESERKRMVVDPSNGVLLTVSSGETAALVVTSLNGKNGEMAYDWRYRESRKAPLIMGSGAIPLDGGVAVSNVAQFLLMWRADKVSPALIYCPDKVFVRLFPKAHFEELP